MRMQRAEVVAQLSERSPLIPEDHDLNPVNGKILYFLTNCSKEKNIPANKKVKHLILLIAVSVD